MLTLVELTVGNQVATDYVGTFTFIYTAIGCASYVSFML